MYSTGEKPGKGRYKCVKCGLVITLDDNSDTLPPCSKCNGTKWAKIG
jgi:DNA-directed RNA polymerase subunit RPC12/RpoP